MTAVVKEKAKLGGVSLNRETGDTEPKLSICKGFGPSSFSGPQFVGALRGHPLKLERYRED